MVQLQIYQGVLGGINPLANSSAYGKCSQDMGACFHFTAVHIFETHQGYSWHLAQEVPLLASEQRNHISMVSPFSSQFISKSIRRTEKTLVLMHKDLWTADLQPKKNVSLPEDINALR